MALRAIAQSELNRLLAQLQTLREALTPFAEFAKSLPPVLEGVPRLTDSGPAIVASPFGKNHIVTFGDFRNALTLLSALEEADNLRFLKNIEEQMTPAISTDEAALSLEDFIKSQSVGGVGGGFVK